MWRPYCNLDVCSLGLVLMLSGKEQVAALAISKPAERVSPAHRTGGAADVMLSSPPLFGFCRLESRWPFWPSPSGANFAPSLRDSERE